MSFCMTIRLYVGRPTQTKFPANVHFWTVCGSGLRYAHSFTGLGGRKSKEMSSLMITCPRTGLDVWTGVDTDPESLKSLPHDWFYTPCPHCGVDHAWRT